MPNAVHDHARGERIVRVQHRLSQLHAAGVFRAKRLGVECLEESPRHSLSRLLMVSAYEQRPVNRLRLQHAGGTLRLRDLCFEFAILGNQLGHLGRGVRGVAQQSFAHEVVQELGLLVVHRPLPPGADALPHGGGVALGQPLGIGRFVLGENRLHELGHLLLWRRLILAGHQHVSNAKPRVGLV